MMKRIWISASERRGDGGRGFTYGGWVMGVVAVMVLSGCVLAPKETKEETKRLEEVGKAYERPVEQRVLPEVPSPAGWQDVLQRALLANGDLESAYFEWKAAMERIPQAATWPNSNVQVGYERMFTRESMKAWDQTTLSAGFDPAMSLTAPIKARQAGKVALEEARAAGWRFQKAKFDLQRKVLTAYLELALMEEKVRIQRDNMGLLKLLTETAANRLQAGGPQQDLLKAQIEYRLTENELANMEAQVRAMRAMLNGMLARDAGAELTLPAGLPAARAVTGDDAKLIAAATTLNPELGGLAREVEGRKDAVELAKLRYLPDFNITASITGDVSKSIGAMVVLPTTIPMIRGAVNEARAIMRSTEAMLRQTSKDRAASFVAALYAMRNAERQVELFQQRIGPAAEQVFSASRQAYSAGAVQFADLIDSQRTLLEVRRMIAEARVEREKRLVELEALAGVDVERIR